MNIVKDIVQDLKETKLWTVALGLVVLIVVFPMMLAKPGDPPAGPAMPTAGVTGNEGPTLALTRASKTGFDRPPKVNDQRLDPFADRGFSALEKAAKSLGADADAVISGDDGTGAGGGSNDPGTADPGPEPDGPKTPEPDTDPKVETEQDDVLSVLVTEGDEEPKELADLRTLSPLPDPENPFLVYVGKATGNSATFLVSSDVVVASTSDGKCDPSPQDCRTLTMAIGDTAEFTLLLDNNRKISVTVIDLETKEVPVGGDEETDAAASLEAEARVAGAKALKSVLDDETVVRSLMRQKVKIRS